MRNDQTFPLVIIASSLMALGIGARRDAAAAVPAFPGAEGFGAQSVGGRGGRVIEVTNLNDAGPGSLRAACEAKGPRIVVFRVGGTITLKRGIGIVHPYITIAGQTAPGGGITLRDAVGSGGTPINIRTEHVIVRYLRSRPGSSAKSRTIDAITITGGKNIIVDHCSASWASDENFSIWSTRSRVSHVTVQWCIISEGLLNSKHPKGGHSMGLLVGGNTQEKKARKLSIHHNLIAHNQGRSPRLKTPGVVDFVNNVIYNYGSRAGWASAGVKLNYVGNYIKKGPNSHPTRPELILTGMKPVQTRPDKSVYLLDNIGPNRPDASRAQWSILGQWSGPKPSFKRLYTDQRYDAPHVSTTSADVAYKQVLADAGASLPKRDAVDERVVNDVRNGTGKIIDEPAEVGGWPKLASGTPPPDADHDGMPDAWEIKRGLNPHDPTDNTKDRDGDGYTNIEEYINGLVSRVSSKPPGRSSLKSNSRRAVGLSQSLLKWQLGSSGLSCDPMRSWPVGQWPGAAR